MLRRVGQFTHEHVRQPVNILVGGEVRLRPFIQEPIAGGAFPISGIGSLEEATDLAARLRGGKAILTVAPLEWDHQPSWKAG